MILVSCNGIKKDYGSECVIKNATFEVQEGERVAIVGPNGCGKSTILKIISKLENLDAGEIAVKKDIVVGYLEQNPEYDKEFLVQDVINMAFHEVLLLRQQLRELEEQLANTEDTFVQQELLRKYSLCSERYEHLGGYELEERYSRVYQGLNIMEEFLERPFHMLSGGEKTLVCLAKILLINPDLLILDEPTNHLDTHMMDWLENYLLGYKGSVLMVSHDRYFLGKIATKVIDLEGGVAVSYPYSYSKYVEEKRILRQQQEEAYKEQQKQIHKMELAVKRMRQWAAQADNESMFTRAKAMEKRIERMDKVEKPKNVSYQARFEFMDSDRSGKDVVQIENLTKAFDHKQLFKNACMSIFYQEHVAIIGKNGCGKTTLLRMLFREETCDSGVIKLGASIRIGYLPQIVSFENEEGTVIQVFRDGRDMSEGRARELLAKYLFKGENVFKKVKNLSGGERSRLKFAMLLQDEINFLVLDEPTNHLDIPSRERLEEVLLSFDGTILMISHDRYFINRLATRVVEVTDGIFESYAGGYDDFVSEKEKLKKGTEIFKVVPTKEKKTTEVTKNHSNVRKSSSSNEYKVKKLEEEIESLEERKKLILEEIEKVANDYVQLSALEQERNDIEDKLEQVMYKWLELSNS